MNGQNTSRLGRREGIPDLYEVSTQGKLSVFLISYDLIYRKTATQTCKFLLLGISLDRYRQLCFTDLFYIINYII
jgi:hypothetical protein